MEDGYKPLALAMGYLTGLLYKTVDGQALYANVYAPPAGEREPGRLLPAVLFVGREIAAYTCWGKLAAASGLMAVTFDYSLIGHFEHLREAEQDMLDLLDYVRGQGERLGIDANRLGILGMFIAFAHWLAYGAARRASFYSLPGQLLWRAGPGAFAH